MDVKRSRNKLNPNLFTVVDTEKKEKRKQAVLHEKHPDIPKETVIIENRIGKSIRKILGEIWGKTWRVIVAALAFTGGLCLLLPATRNEFFNFVQIYIIDWLKENLPFWS